MKIKFKEPKAPHITNITFQFSQSRHLAKKLDLKNHMMSKSPLHHKKPSQTSFENTPIQTTKNFHTSLLVKYNSFIPKNPNMKSVILANDRQAKPVKSLQSAKQIQKKFPVRKILTKASTMGMFYRKDKVFEFQNPQAELQLFKNKEISNFMARSQGSFYNRSKIYEELKTDNSQSHQRLTKTPFKRYDMRNSLTSSSTSLEYRGTSQSLSMFRSKRLSNPVP